MIINLIWRNRLGQNLQPWYKLSFFKVCVPIFSVLMLFSKSENIGAWPMKSFNHKFKVILTHITMCYIMIVIITRIKNNCLKLKNEVGMAVLKSKQTRVVASYIEIISTYV